MSDKFVAMSVRRRISRVRGQRCREYAMTVIGMVGRGAVQGDAIREARAVNDDWKLVSSASL